MEEVQIIESLESLRTDLRIHHKRHESPSFLSKELNGTVRSAALENGRGSTVQGDREGQW